MNRFHERDLDVEACLFYYNSLSGALSLAQTQYAPVPARPFGSDLIPQILRNILIEHCSKQDNRLYDHVIQQGIIPLKLIVMIASLVRDFSHRRLDTEFILVDCS